MPGFKLAGVDSEHKDDVEEDTTGASIGTRVSYGVLGGEWEYEDVSDEYYCHWLSTADVGPESVCGSGVVRCICENEEWCGDGRRRAGRVIGRPVYHGRSSLV